MIYRGSIVRKRLAALIAFSLIATSVPIPTLAAPEGSPVNPVDGAFAPVGAVSSGVTAAGGLARYQEAAPEPGADVWVDPATAGPSVGDLTAPDQGIAPAPAEEWVEQVPTDAAPEPFIEETPAETSAPLDPAPSEWVDPATGAWVEPAPVAPIPAAPVPGVAPAPVDMGLAGGSEPWGQPIATAFIVGTNGQGAPCHAGPAWEAAPLTVLGEGEAVEVRAETAGEWQPVNCAGVGGYVPAAMLAWTPVTPADPAAVGGGRPNGKAASGTDIGGEQIAAFALQYQGYPYIYAGEGPYAFDCSGFTMFVIQNTLGIEVPHDMTVQYAMGQPVSREGLQPGDLVFFANTFRPGMSHNGIYIGGGQFVHAETESSGVTISDLYDDYYNSRWYGAVRFS